MTKLTIFIFLFSAAFLSYPSFSLELTVKVDNLKEMKKKISFELYLLDVDKSKGWHELQMINSDYVVLDPQKMEVQISQLEPALYALRIYQDLNNNGELDKSNNQIPLEPIGFSENPSLFAGEPIPEDAAFELKENKRIVIKLKHKKAKRKHKKPR